MNYLDRTNDLQYICKQLFNSEQSFLKYAKIYNIIKKTDINNVGYISALRKRRMLIKSECLSCFNSVVISLEHYSKKYNNDAIGFAINEVLEMIYKWNKESIRAKYAALWFKNFRIRFESLISLKSNLNSSKPRQNQIMNIAKKEYDIIEPAYKVLY